MKNFIAVTLIENYSDSIKEREILLNKKEVKFFQQAVPVPDGSKPVSAYSVAIMKDGSALKLKVTIYFLNGLN